MESHVKKRNERWLLRLYMDANAPETCRVQAYVTGVCEGHLAGQYVLEVIDVRRHSKKALSAGITVLPSLVRVTPEPSRTIVGDLRNPAYICEALGLPMSCVPSENTFSHSASTSYETD